MIESNEYKSKLLLLLVLIVTIMTTGCSDISKQEAKQYVHNYIENVKNTDYEFESLIIETPEPNLEL